MFRTSEYGFSTGPDVPIEGVKDTIKIGAGGIDLSKGSKDLVDGQSPDSSDVVFDGKGVAPDNASLQLGPSYVSDGQDASVVSLHAYQKSSLAAFVLRMRPTRWDRFNGTNWLTLPGSLTGTSSDHVSTVVMDDLLIAANGKDKLKKWDGNDVTAIADLSADAPVAHYIARVGQRILAARINAGGGVNPNLVQWCGDGLITDWTNASNGAGLADLLPEGPSPSANIITGLSTLAEAAVVYRQRSIVLAQLTGIGAAPFRFTTIDFSHGTDSPYSIGRGGAIAGDFYLGHDYLVRLFDGRSAPVPIGLPIIDTLRESITDVGLCYGNIDTKRQEYWLGIPTDSSGLLTQAWIFNIKEFLRSQKLVWRKRVFSTPVKSIGFGPIPSQTDPLVNSMNLVPDHIVDNVGKVVNDYANSQSRDRIILGEATGNVQYITPDTYLTSGYWQSRQVGDQSLEFTVDRCRLVYTSPIPATVEVSISTNGGFTWQQPKVLNLLPTHRAANYAGTYFRITGRLFQVRVRFLSGYVNISEVQLAFQPRGAGVF